MLELRSSLRLPAILITARREGRKERGREGRREKGGGKRMEGEGEKRERKYMREDRKGCEAGILLYRQM